MTLIERHIADSLLAALDDTPVVLLHGPRQSGKSTLVRHLCQRRHKAAYYTLDDPAVLTAVTRDPDGFLHGIDGPVAIDEVQLAPDLFRAIKLEVDRHRAPGRFLLTGSADIQFLPNLSESLAGRMDILTLSPFSVGELNESREGLIDVLFDPAPLPPLTGREESRAQLLHSIVRGGYPEAVQRKDPRRRHAWFAAYLTTILQRDVRQMADIAGLTELPRLFALLAAQSGGLLNMAELSRDIGMAQPTIKRYLALLQATHLYQPLPAWAASTRKRLVKAAKVYLNDTGLLTYLLGTDAEQLSHPSATVGQLIEAFVCQELRKQISWSLTQPSLYYYRTAAGREVDFVLEHRDGRIVGIEVKAAAHVRQDDLSGLDDLADTADRRFHRGILLYGGSAVVPFAPNTFALPISALWRMS